MSIGIAVGRREVCAVRAVVGEKGAHVQAIHSAPLSDDAFAGLPTPAAESNLASALAKVAADAKGKFLPCHVALPDPMVRLTVFELDDLPTSEKTRLELLRWRFAKEYSVDGQTLDCAYQGLGQENGKRLLMGQAMDSVWRQCITRALRRVGIIPWSMNMGACYRFNQFHERFTKEKEGAAMVALDPDSWSVFLWDAATRPRLLRTRWRTGIDAGVDVYDAIALEAERSILSYVRSSMNSSVTRVYAISHAQELEGFAAALDRRLREKCTPLTASDLAPRENRGTEAHELASLSLAAAVAA